MLKRRLSKLEEAGGKALPPLLVWGDPTDKEIRQCQELGREIIIACWQSEADRQD